MPSAQELQIDDAAGIAMTRSGADVRSLLQAIHSASGSNLSLLHPRGKVLFAEGEAARGVFILRTGRATVSISSSEGRVVILQIARPGDVLGLNSALRNESYNTTVQTIESTRTHFISREQLVEVIKENQPVAYAISQILSREIAELTERARSLLLPQTVIAKLARLLLEWCEESRAKGSSPLQIARTFTHEDLARMICSSRETVTRLLAGLNRRRILRMTPDSFLIVDHAALQKIAVGLKA